MGDCKVQAACENLEALITVFCPLPQEASVFSLPEKIIQKPIKVGPGLQVIISGVGAKNQIHVFDQVASNTTQIISWGTAAGLEPHLSAGELLLPEMVKDDSGMAFRTERTFTARLEQLLNNEITVHKGLLAQSNTVLSSASQKANFAKKHKAIACDMESATIGSLADKNHIPFNVIRVIVDEINTTLPHSALIAMSEFGKINYSKMVLSILQHPGDLAKLFALSGKFSKAKETLARVSKVLHSTPQANNS